MTFQGSAGATYTANGFHRAKASMWDYDYTYWPFVSIFYWDPFNFSFFENDQIVSPYHHAFLGPGPPTTRPAAPILLGMTTDEDSVTIPYPRELFFTQACYSGVCGSFTNLGQRDDASINLSNASDIDRICNNPTATGSDFEITISFTFPSGATIDPRNSTRNKVLTGKDNQFDWTAWDFKTMQSASGSMSIRLFRKSHTLPKNYADIELTGNYPSGTVGSFNGRGRVHLVCP